MGQLSQIEPAWKRRPRDARSLPLAELCGAYGLILATCWTPRPLQRWLYIASVVFLLFTSWRSFPGWQALGFRRAGLLRSLWVVLAAAIALAVGVWIALAMHTYHGPHGLARWVFTFGGYVVWSFVQQYLLQGYFLFRFLKLLPRREYAALAAAGIFAAAHLPNPVLTPLTLVWGVVACFVFLQCRNIYPLMLAHAMLGIMISICVPGPVVRNMRVGLGYLQYRRPVVPIPPATSMQPEPRTLPYASQRFSTPVPSADRVPPAFPLT